MRRVRPTRKERKAAKESGVRINTVRQAFLRYYEDHGQHTIDTVRMMVAWNNVRVELGSELIGESLYKKTAAFYKKRVGDGISPETVRRELTATLVAPLRHCLRLGLIRYMPPLFTVKQKQIPRTRILSDEEITSLLDAAREWPWLFKTVVILAYTAQRIRAVLELEWWQVDMKAMLINFNRKGDRMWERKKGRGVVPMSGDLYIFMSEWARAAALGRQPRVVGELPAAFYFHWRRMVKRAGLGLDVTPHVVRHSIATKLVREGKDIRLVQLLLGHKSLTTTEAIYVKNNPETIRSAVAGLSFTSKPT